LGVIDFLTGYELSFSIFYLGPIVCLAWFGGAARGYFLALLSAGVWMIADVSSGHEFTNALLPFWNTLVRLGIFALTVSLVARLNAAYAAQVRLVDELRVTLENVKVLKGLIPICAWCKKVRDDEGFWDQVEAYITKHSDASFTHGMCPECMENMKREVEADSKSQAGAGVESKLE